MTESIYSHRHLSEGFPDLESRGVEYHAAHHEGGEEFTEGYYRCIAHLIDLTKGNRSTVVVGCGPKPQAIVDLRSKGLDAVGLEPVEGIAASAAKFLGDESSVHVGPAEAMPFSDLSVRVVWMTSVLEHVDSPIQSLREAYRVLEPGGVLFLYTTNRWKFSRKGFNGEFSTRYFNWFPKIVQESYVFNQLHYNPALANYNARPAVHWFSYSQLCNIGRQAGFGQFYSWVDLVEENSPLLAIGHGRRRMFRAASQNPWLRAASLTQAGGCIFMLKRFE